MTSTERHPIEVESYRIMHQRVDLSMWPAGQREVVERMVHATADVSFATSTRIGARALHAALGALDDGAPVVVDSAMLAAGVRLDTICALDEIATAQRGSTRSAAAIALAAERHPVGAIWVVGNAPTALAEVLALHQRRDIVPAAVIGLPVGFVGAADTKAALWAGPLASVSITNVGERGGSAVAAAVLNALCRLREGGPC